MQNVIKGAAVVQHSRFQQDVEESKRSVYMHHNGCHLYVQLNEGGGYTYVSDEIGGGVEVWDTSLVDRDSIIAALNDEAKQRAHFPVIKSLLSKHWPVGPEKKFVIDGKEVDLEVYDYLDGKTGTRDKWTIEILELLRNAMDEIYSNTNYNYLSVLRIKYANKKLTAKFLGGLSVQQLRAIHVLLTQEIADACNDKYDRS